MKQLISPSALLILSISCTTLEQKQSTAAYRALEAGDLTGVMRVLDEAQPPFQKQLASGLLGRSLQTDDDEAAFALLDRFDDLKPSNQSSRLQHVVERGHRGLLELLIANGSDPRIGRDQFLIRDEIIVKHADHTSFHVDQEQDSLLAVAVRAGHLDCMELLLDSGCDPNAIWIEEGVNAMTVFGGLGFGGTRNMRFIFDANTWFEISGDEVRMSGYPNDTSWMPVLHLAAAGGNLDVLQLLLRRGAEPKAQDSAGRSAHQVASEAGHAELARLLPETP